MAAITYGKLFFTTTQANYDANKLAGKLDNTKLYFTTDTHEIYKGTQLYTEKVIVVAEKPQTPAAGKIYVITGTGTVETYNGSSWTVISYPIVTSTVGIDENSTDVSVPSAKAVYDAIADLAASDDVVAGIAQKTTQVANPDYDSEDPTSQEFLTVNDIGSFTYTMADGTTTHDVQLAGLAKAPTWNNSTGTLTIPVVGGSDVTLEIGREKYLGSAEYLDGTDATHPNSIKLTFNTSTQENPDVLYVPLGDLVDIYTVSDTDSIDMNISSNTISGTVKLSNKSNNAIELIDATAAAQENPAVTTGLYVDASQFASASAFATLNNAVEGEGGYAERLGTAETNIGTIDGRVEDLEDTVNGRAESGTEGQEGYVAPITGLTSRMTTAEGNISDLQDYVTGLDALVSNVWGELSAPAAEPGE